jgi:hypothetical protein
MHDGSCDPAYPQPLAGPPAATVVERGGTAVIEGEGERAASLAVEVGWWGGETDRQ